MSLIRIFIRVTKQRPCTWKAVSQPAEATRLYRSRQSGMEPGEVIPQLAAELGALPSLHGVPLAGLAPPTSRPADWAPHPGMHTGPGTGAGKVENPWPSASALCEPGSATFCRCPASQACRSRPLTHLRGLSFLQNASPHARFPARLPHTEERVPAAGLQTRQEEAPKHAGLPGKGDSSQYALLFCQPGPKTSGMRPRRSPATLQLWVRRSLLEKGQLPAPSGQPNSAQVLAPQPWVLGGTSAGGYLHP